MPYWAYILLLILAIYVVISILLFFLQDYFMFRPEKLPKDFDFYYENQEIEEYNVDTRDGAIINGLRFKTQNPNIKIIL